MKTLNILALIALASALSACSNGSSSTPPKPSVPSVEIELSSSNLSLDEGSTTTFSLTATPGAIISIEGGSVVSLTERDNDYLLTAGEVDRTILETFKITGVLDGRKPTSVNLNVVVNNISSATTEGIVEATLQNRDSVLGLEEDAAVYRAIVEGLYLQQGLNSGGISSASMPMSYSEKEALIADFKPLTARFHYMLNNYLDVLNDIYAEYTKGQASEIQLKAALKQAQDAIKWHSDYGAEKLSPLFQALYPGVEIAMETTIEFSSEAGRYTRFVGNPAFGSVESETGEWSFSPSFGLLETLIPTKENNVGFCEVQS